VIQVHWVDRETAVAIRPGKIGLLEAVREHRPIAAVGSTLGAFIDVRGFLIVLSKN
jgi:hypothetical protein